MAPVGVGGLGGEFSQAEPCPHRRLRRPESDGAGLESAAGEADAKVGQNLQGRRVERRRERLAAQGGTGFGHVDANTAAHKSQCRGKAHRTRPDNENLSAT
jgi:hypothetical protein